jgi:hypothetical protein
MTPEEFCKKWCYNSHDPATCGKLRDLRVMMAAKDEEIGFLQHDYQKCVERNAKIMRYVGKLLNAEERKDVGEE